MAVTLARKAHYELADFHMSKKRGISGFSLTIEKEKVASEDFYSGTFQEGQKTLKVHAFLEKFNYLLKAMRALKLVSTTKQLC